MSIRQMSFEEGQALNIRQCPKLPPKDTTIEELKNLLENKAIKIVKSGKSYYDVTAKPEIFEQAHDDYKIETLTLIDQRDLRKTDVNPAFSDTTSAGADPMALLFQNTSQSEEEEYEEYDRKTYYLRPNQIEALRLICFKEVKDISETVRELLDIAITEKSNQYGVDFIAEADKNLLDKPRKPRKRRKKKV